MNRFRQRLEGSLSKKNRAKSSWRPLNNSFGKKPETKKTCIVTVLPGQILCSPFLIHHSMGSVDVKTAWSQMVDMRPSEASNIRKQGMDSLYIRVYLRRDEREIMPPKALKGEPDEQVAVILHKPTLLLGFGNEIKDARMKDLSFVEDLGSVFLSWSAVTCFKNQAYSTPFRLALLGLHP